MMNRLHSKRLIYISILLSSLFIAVSLILYALKQNINVFLTPTELVALSPPPHHRLRLGGMVKAHSVIREKTGLTVKFVVTDFNHELAVNYQGILPDLFREGKGIVAEGYLNSQGLFIAQSVLAKHDENYMPPTLKIKKTRE